MKTSRQLSTEEAEWQRNLKRIWLEKKQALGLTQETAAARAGWKTQTAVNKWVRERDSGLPCISCGKPDGVGKRNAGHYRPAGVNSALRFDPRNIHGQCETCNTHKSGNLTAYRVELIRRIGIDAVVELDDNHNTKRWSIHELASICQAVKLGISPYSQGNGKTAI